MRSRVPAAAGAIAVAVIAVVAAVFWPGSPPPSAAFSFESNMEGWTAAGTDLASGNCTGSGASGNCTVGWSIERSQDRATDGSFSLKFYLENINDMGKIWIVRPFNVTPHAAYHVRIAFAFATADFGSMNLWQILAGAATAAPATAADLVGMYQGDTGNGLASDGGFVWLDKAYDATATADGDGRVWVFVGIWGTWETPRTYYLDALQVTLTPA